MLGGHLAGEPVGTRGFEEREGPLRDLDDADLRDALTERMATLSDVAAAAERIAGVPADTDVAWTGRTMKVPWFAEHMREELVLHGWDITGYDGIPHGLPGRVGRAVDDDAQRLCGGPTAAGEGSQAAAARRADRGTVASRRHRRRLARADRPHHIGLAAPEGPAALETDAAARVLLLWGRRPADPSRICSRVGPEALGRLRLCSAVTERRRLSSCYRRPRLAGSC